MSHCRTDDLPGLPDLDAEYALFEAEISRFLTRVGFGLAGLLACSIAFGAWASIV